jgi:hypothetical protein
MRVVIYYMDWYVKKVNNESLTEKQRIKLIEWNNNALHKSKEEE